jgi:charged multivesicular body protein 1
MLVAVQISNVMDQFELQFDRLDLKAQTMEKAMGAAVTLSTPPEAVDTLLQEVASENGIELSSQVQQASGAAVQQSTGATAASDDEALSRRLAEIRSRN